MSEKVVIPAADDMKAWTVLWAQYPGQSLSVAKSGNAIKLTAGGHSVVRRDLATLVKELWMPEAHR